MSETIAAIATPISPAGLGIVRLSGPDALSIAGRCFKSTGNFKIEDAKSHTVHYGFICDGEEQIDEVLCIYLKGPKSFTGEDTVEIDCHGGVYIMKRILEILVKCGARLAEPGEFTKRAFLNGRIDLSRAEAVMDLISSNNESARRNSVSQLKGRLYGIVKDLREEVLFNVAFIESALDDPEHISIDGFADKLSGQCKSILDRLNSLKKSFENGRLICEGINTVIVGKPNVGKSSFLNLLLGEERAIVTPIPGTTRDTLEESVSIDGIVLNLTDTAGIRETDDFVESIGVEKARHAIENADLVILIFDSSSALSESDKEIIPLLRGHKIITILNKTDLNQVIRNDDIYSLFKENGLSDEESSLFSVIPFSAMNGEGFDDFVSSLKDMFFTGKISSDSEFFLSNVRHLNCVNDAYTYISNVLTSIENGLPEDFYSIDLMGAYSSLGLIIGEEVDDDLVDEIFSKFCMGK